MDFTPAGRVGPSFSTTPWRKPVEGVFVRHAFDLDPVGLRLLVARIGEPCLQRAIVGEDQQALAVGIEAPGGIDARHVDVVLQGALAGLAR